MADKLVLTAELVGKFEKDLRDFNRVQRTFYAEQAKVASAAQKFFRDARAPTEGFKKFHEGSSALRRELKALGDSVGKVSPEFAKIGDAAGRLAVGAGSVVGVIAAVGAATAVAGKKLGDFSKSMQTLRYAAVQSGLSVTQMRQLENVGARFGMTSDEVRQGAIQFGQSMTFAANNYEEFNNKLRQTGFGDLADTLHNRLLKDANDTVGALQDVRDYMDRLRKQGATGEQKANIVAQTFFGSADWARMSAKDFADALKRSSDIDTAMGLTPERLKAIDRSADEFRKDIGDTEQIFQNISKLFNADIEPAFHKFVTDFNALFTNKAQDWSREFGDMLATDLRDLEGIVKLFEWIEAHTPDWLKALLSGRILGAVRAAGGVGGQPTFRPGIGPGRRPHAPEFPGGGLDAPGVGFAPGGGGVFAGPQGGGVRGGEPFSEPAGTRIHGAAGKVTLPGGGTASVSQDMAAQTQGFIDSLIAAGAPITSVGGFGMRGNPSAHPGGHAIDINQVGRNVMSPAFSKWYAEHTELVAAQAKKWGFIEGRNFSSPDAGHFSASHILTPTELAAARDRGGGRAIGAVGPLFGGAGYGDPSLIANARQAIDSSNQKKIEGSGKIDVTVGAGKEGARNNHRNILRRIPLQRSRQMEPSSTGPSEPAPTFDER